MTTRNYYYGVETFFYTNTYVIVPMPHRLVHRRHRDREAGSAAIPTPPIKSSRGAFSC